MLICSGQKTRPLAFLRKKVMPRDSFDKLCQYRHLNNNKKAIPRDKPNHKLCKVRLFLDAVVKSFHKQYRLNQNLSVDEAMVAFKGQLSMKQNIPPKPIKRDINVWECAEIKWLHMQPSSLRITEHGLGYLIV